MDIKDILKKSRSSSRDEIWVNKFDEESAQEFREDLLEAAKGDPQRPIVIYIDSYGGFVDALAKMIETMDEVPNPLVTVCMGKAMSCGAILLSHGDVRFCGPHSRVMVHEVSGGVQVGDVHDMYNDATEVKRLNKHFLGLLAQNCKIEGGYEGLRKLIKGREGRDMWMDAETSLKFGIVDAVGLPKVDHNTINQVTLLKPAKTVRRLSRVATKSDKKSKTKKAKTDSK